MTRKHTQWKWNPFKAFNLNMSFINFDLKYSGEACLQECIIIKSRHTITLGRYCGRRYQWSVFVNIAPIILKFDTFDSSTSWFELLFEITEINMTSYILNNKINSEFNSSFVFPFASINKYLIRNNNYYNWNIYVKKMYKLSLKLMKHSNQNNIWYLYDGPDYHSDQYDLSSMTLFTSSSFQVSILFHGYFNEIESNFHSYFFKEAIKNYKIYSVNNRLDIQSTDLNCADNLVNLCAFKFIVNRHLYVNITLSFKYLGPNVGYCKYGGLSVYDYVNNTIKEVLLSCDNWFTTSLNLQPNRTLVSSTDSLFLVLYSYNPYSEIEVQLQIKPSSCQGVILER